MGKSWTWMVVVAFGTSSGCGGTNSGPGQHTAGGSGGIAAGGGGTGGAMGSGGAGAGTGGASSTGPIPEDQLSARVASALCAAMAQCCVSNDFTYDPATCVTNATALYDALMVRESGLQVAYDATAAGQCVDAYTSRLLACNANFYSSIPFCDRIFGATVSLGGACTDDQECDSGYCDGTSCAPDPYPDQERGALGQACVGDCTTFANGFACSGSIVGTNNVYCYTNDGLNCDSATDRCVALPVLGQACNSDGCAGDAYCEASVCTEKHASGPCTNSDACSDASYCDASLQQCVPAKLDGEPCVSHYECQSDNCDGGACSPNIPVNAAFCEGYLVN